VTEIILNKENLEYMRRVTLSAIIPHAIIIEGPQGSGKFTLALHFAAMMNCARDDAPCGECPSCNKIFSGVHADVSVLDLEDDKKIIPVAKVREIISDAALIPSEAEKRVFIIRNGQALNPQAQNAFLKIFEEPPKNVVFLLLTTDKKLLLPTILSRAVLLKTQPLPNDIMEKELSKSTKAAASDITAAVSVAQGSLGKARELLSGTKILKLRGVAEGYFSVMKTTTSVFALSEAFPPQTYKREELSVILPFLRLGWRDLALCKVTDDFTPLFFTDKALMKEAASKISSENIVMLYEKTDSLCSALLSNINPYTAVSVFNSYVAEYAKLG